MPLGMSPSFAIVIDRPFKNGSCPTTWGGHWAGMRWAGGGQEVCGKWDGGHRKLDTTVEPSSITATKVSVGFGVGERKCGIGLNHQGLVQLHQSPSHIQAPLWASQALCCCWKGDLKKS